MHVAVVELLAMLGTTREFWMEMLDGTSAVEKFFWEVEGSTEPGVGSASLRNKFKNRVVTGTSEDFEETRPERVIDLESEDITFNSWR